MGSLSQTAKLNSVDWEFEFPRVQFNPLKYEIEASVPLLLK